MSKYIHAPGTLKETCRCGHHKSTHHLETGACLGVHCDDCFEYDDASKPKLPPAPPSTDPIPAVLPDLDDDVSVAPVAPYYYPWAYPPAPTYPPYSPTGTP
jgi:hypothetical protein